MNQRFDISGSDGQTGMGIHTTSDEDAAHLLEASTWAFCNVLDHCARNHPAVIGESISDLLQELDHLSIKYGFALDIAVPPVV
jgi:hypothetical protein